MILCPYCDKPMTVQTDGRPLGIMTFCENPDCPVKPVTERYRTASAMLTEVKAMYKSAGKEWEG